MKILRSTLAGLALAGTLGTASAVPQLQLGILNGVYDTTTQTVIASSSSFTLYAFLTPQGNPTQAQIDALLADTYYISAALVPKTATSGTFGSFDYDGTTVNVTADMTYGVPPLESLLATRDPGDLATHGIYQTYFEEFAFNFTAANQTGIQDVVSATGTNAFTGLTAGTGMYYAAVTVDVANLDASTAIHFDLYSEKIKAGGDIDINDFAPFSHDAQSKCLPGDDCNGGGGGGGGGTPEPASIALFGLGLLGMAAARRRRRA